MEPEEILDTLTKQLTAALAAMPKAKTLEEKVAYSQVIKNLSESMGVFLNLALDNMTDYDFEDE